MKWRKYRGEIAGRDKEEGGSTETIGRDEEVGIGCEEIPDL